MKDPQKQIVISLYKLGWVFMIIAFSGVLAFHMVFNFPSLFKYTTNMLTPSVLCFLSGAFIEMVYVIRKVSSTRIIKILLPVLLTVLGYCSMSFTQDAISYVTGFHPGAYMSSTTILTFFNSFIIISTFTVFGLMFVSFVFMLLAIPLAFRSYPVIDVFFNWIEDRVLNDKYSKYMSQKFTSKLFWLFGSRTLGSVALMLIPILLLRLNPYESNIVKDLYSFIIFEAEYKSGANDPRIPKNTRVCFHGDGLVTYAYRDSSGKILFEELNHNNVPDES